MATIWAPNSREISDAALLQRAENMTYSGQPPISRNQIDLLSDISRALMNDPKARLRPQYIALAYWLRRSALEGMIADLDPIFHTATSVTTARGVALHLPPTNVDTIFVYSWALSVLAGNCNIVRVSEHLSKETEWLVSTIAKIVEEHHETDRHIFCSYSYGSSFEQSLSQLCDLRMIWGGDAKVTTVSKTPIRPDGLSLGFPDRKSLSAIKFEAYHNSTNSERDSLADRLFNDIYWFDQMGCGSPRLIVWVGKPQLGLKEDLYARLENRIQNKGFLVETGVAIRKFAYAGELLADDTVDGYSRISNELNVVTIKNPSKFLSDSQGGGFIGDFECELIENIAAFANRKLQTIGVFGFERDELRTLAKCLIGRGGYRIVPIGQALQFNIDWDGIPLMYHMTRKITYAN